ncbi:MAG: hypothetical protein HQ526_09725 [Actinobacteria bacterium]|nr:hypothetical protein [Actinomycetota bacterium]
MHTGKRIRHATHKALLTFLGPAQLDQDNDPIRRLDREHEALFGPAPKRTQKVYAKKRNFERTPVNV